MTSPWRRESAGYAERMWRVRSIMYADAELMMISGVDMSHYSEGSLLFERSCTLEIRDSWGDTY